MNLYVYRPDSNYFAGIGFSLQDDERVVDAHFTDSRVGDEWIAPVARVYKEDPEPQGDFPTVYNYGKIPVVSQRAWDVLRPLIGYCCEALPIIHPTGKPFYMIHVLETIDCLDEERSEVKRFTDGGIMRILRYSFKEQMLEGKHIFKLPVTSSSGLFVDEVFRSAVERNELKGLLFRELRKREGRT
jgi:hypothetical protein